MTTRTRSLTALLSTAALVLLTGAVGAQDQAQRRPQQVPPTGADDAAPPTPVDLQGLTTLQAITSRSLEGLTFERRADGTLSIDLQGRFQHVLMATPGVDGRLDITCLTGEHAHATPAVAIQAFRPVRGGSLQPLDVSALRGRLPKLVAAPAQERQ